MAFFFPFHYNNPVSFSLFISQGADSQTQVFPLGLDYQTHGFMQTQVRIPGYADPDSFFSDLCFGVGPTTPHLYSTLTF